MCISVAPGDFNETYIADFPATSDSDTDRVLSYLNIAEAPGAQVPAYLRALGLTAMAETVPNAMLFAVYGDNVRVLPSSNPQASREWIREQHAMYRETWEAQPEDALFATRGGLLPGFGFDDGPEIVRSGNYNVSIARDVADIPRILAALKEASHGNVPDVSPTLLEQMERYYTIQGLGVPRFVVAAFALQAGGTVDMHPITVRYDQMPSVHGKVVLPALDYHGRGEWQAHVKRDHHLLIATRGLMRLLSPAAAANRDANAPTELVGAPAEFPLMIVDRRDSRLSSDQATWAPNNDYVIDTAAIEAALVPAEAELRAVNDADIDEDDRRGDVAEIVRRQLEDGGIMAHSNQAATTAAAYREAMASNRFRGLDLNYDF